MYACPCSGGMLSGDIYSRSETCAGWADVGRRRQTILAKPPLQRCVDHLSPYLEHHRLSRNKLLKLNNTAKGTALVWPKSVYKIYDTVRNYNFVVYFRYGLYGAEQRSP